MGRTACSPAATSSIFPNLAIVDLIMGITIRTYYPIAPDYMEITAWSLQPSDDEPELRDMRQENFLTFWGPAGLATPDDIEALERCQQGLRRLRVRAVERHLPRHGPRPAQLRRRAADAHVLAGVGPAHDRHRAPTRGARHAARRARRLALRIVGR